MGHRIVQSQRLVLDAGDDQSQPREHGIARRIFLHSVAVVSDLRGLLWSAGRDAERLVACSPTSRAGSGGSRSHRRDLRLALAKLAIRG